MIDSIFSAFLPARAPSGHKVRPFCGSKYNFAEVVGKLQWQGDALEEQRKLRDEW